MNEFEISATMRFELVLKNEKIRSYNRMMWMTIVLNLVALTYYGYQNKGEIKWPFIILGLALIHIIIKFFYKKKLGFEFILSYTIIAWASWGFYAIAILIAALLVLYLIAIRKMTAVFSSEIIHYPSFPARRIEWDELSNVVLKDRFLTIDFKNNRIIQHHIINDENDYDLDESAFNQFCRGQLQIKLYKPE